ncbi:MAG TPA: hypothetical protein VFR07_17665 [Mycobacteriales bacterium]|jgi:hypothetical protein|nr:hypothetical protein [Mycobacteriales bacterium]
MISSQSAPSRWLNPVQLDASLGLHVRAAAALALLLISAWCSLFLVTAVAGPVQPGAYGFMATPSGALLTHALTFVSLGGCTYVTFLGSQQCSWRAGPLTRLVLVLVAVNLVLATCFRLGAATLESSHGLGSRLSGLCLMVVAFASLLYAVGGFWSRPALGPAALTVALLACAACGFAFGFLGEPWQANVDYRSDVLFRLIPSAFSVLLLAFLFYSYTQWARFAVATTRTALTCTGPLGPVIVGGVLAAKLAWSVAGLVGVLPTWLWGNASIWREIRSDRVGAWTTALAVGLGLVLLLSRKAPGAARTTTGSLRPLILLLGVLLVPAALASLFTVLRTALLSYSAMLGLARQIDLPLPVALLERLASALRAVPQELPAAFTANFFVVPLVSLLLGLALLVPKGTRVPVASFLVFLVAVAVGHSLLALAHFPVELSQEAAGATGDLIQPPSAATVFPLPANPLQHLWSPDAAVGTFGRPTFDLAVTVALAAALLSARITPQSALTLLLFSAVLGLADIVRPSGDWWYYVSLVVPVAYQFLIDAGPMNHHDQGRPARVLASTGGVLLALTVIGHLMLVGLLWPDVNLVDLVFSYGRGLDATFLLIAIAWYVLAAESSPAQDVPGGVGVPHPSVKPVGPR